MSHPVNDEILESIFENLYEEVKTEFPNEHPAFIIQVVRKRFEDLPEPLDLE